MELFERACDLPEADRAALLETLPPGDADLRGPLAAMLDVDQRSRIFFDVTRGAGAEMLAADMARSLFPERQRRGEDEAIPGRIGEYRVVRRIGAGGMGAVYEAEQEALQRLVAVKTLHAWLVSDAARARFRFEARALAQLVHPGIPQVFTVGEDQGRIYFAMELVRGDTLIEHARGRGLGVRERVELLARICDAVHFAHLRGFVHRDLKPDNVRVEERGPRVLDFGIAAVLGEGGLVIDETVAGTLAYMSPEQAAGTPVDLRTDVWALGVMLFELLAGRRPFELRTRSVVEAARVLQTEPPRLESLDPSLPADLGWITRRAMAREPEGRYASAADLAEDLRRHLDGRAVLAHPPSALYRAGRFTRRNRLPLAIGAAVIAGLVAAAAISTRQYVLAEEARKEAERSRDRALVLGDRAAATVDFLTTLLTEADPTLGVGREVTVRQALERARRRLDDGSLAALPEVEAAVRLTLARTYAGLALRGEIEPNLRRVLELDAQHPLEDFTLPAQAHTLLAEMHWEKGLRDEALADTGRALEILREQGLDEASSAVQDALLQRGLVLRESGSLEEAIDVLERMLPPLRARAAGGDPRHDLLSDVLNDLGIALAMHGRHGEAERALTEGLAIDERAHGPDHVRVASDLHNVAWLYHQTRRQLDALPLLERAARIRIEQLGADDPRLALQRMLEGDILVELRRFPEARGRIEDGVRIMTAAYGPDNPRVLAAQETLAKALVRGGETAEGERLARALIARREAGSGEARYLAGVPYILLGEALLAQGRRAEAEAAVLRAQELVIPQLGTEATIARWARRILGKIREAK